METPHTARNESFLWWMSKRHWNWIKPTANLYFRFQFMGITENHVFVECSILLLKILKCFVICRFMCVHCVSVVSWRWWWFYLCVSFHLVLFSASHSTHTLRFKSTFILYHINTPTLGLEFQHSNKNRQYFFSTDLIEFILCVLCVYNHFGLGTLGQSAQKLRCFIHFFSQRAQILISSKYLYEMEPNRTNDIISFSYSFALFPLCHHFYFRWQNHKMLPE